MRKINNRTVFFAVISLVFGIALSSYQKTLNIACVLGIFALFFFLVLHLISKGDGLPKIIVASFMLAFFVFGIVLGEGCSLVYSYRYTYQTGDVECEITEVSTYSMVGGEIHVDGEKTSGKVLIYCDNTYDFEVGDKVTFNGYISPIEIFENGELNYYYSSGIQYKTTAEDVTFVSLNHTVKNYIKSWTQSACESMFEDNQGIAYAMIFGDSSLVDDASLSLLRRGGVAHIFAVSGLHIGLLYAVLRMFSWLKLRSSLLQKGIYNGLCLAVLFFYVYLCDFTASSLRAFLMILLGIVATHFGVIRDRLSVIAVTAFILLLHSPYIIFSVGFQLSFLTVVGLVILPQKVANHLTLIKNKKLKSAVAFTTSACLSTLLVSCFHFGYLSTISVLLNLAVVPVYSLIYVINLAGLLFYGVFSALGLDKLLSVLSPFFTSEIYSFTITLFEKVESVIPLAYYITIPACVVIAFYAVLYANSGLISDAVSKSHKKALSVCFCIVLVAPSLLPVEVETKGIDFFVTSTQVMTVQTEKETVIFCKSGGDIDLSLVETEKVSVVCYDDFYKDLTISDTNGMDITLYATFLSQAPQGVKSFEDFNSSDCGITITDYATITYQGVEFHLDENITVTNGENTTEITSSGTKYYIIDGFFTSDNTYEKIAR